MNDYSAYRIMVNFDGLVACLLDDQAEANFTVDD
jgi:hypothetical protein